MQTYDILMLVVLAGTTLFGFWKGMAWQIASLASLVVSYFVALRFSAQIAPFFGQQEPLNRFIAMLAIYVGTSFVIWMVFRLVSKAIDRVKLESFDRQLGAVLGFAKGVLLCVAITFFAVTLLGEEQGQKILSSRSGGYIATLLKNAHDVVPPELQPHLQKIEQRLSPDANFTGGVQSANGQDLRDLWQRSESQPASPAGGWPAQPQTPWPTQPQSQPQTWPSQSGSSPAGWPTQTQSQSPTQPRPDPYSTPPREPRPFPGYPDGTPVSVEH